MTSDNRLPQEPRPISADDDDATTWSETLANAAAKIAKAPAGQQLAVGGLSGWCIGYMFMKVGKTLALTVGGGLILLQVASYNGYIEVNWPNADDQVKRWRRRLQKELGIPNRPSTTEKVLQFAKDHVYLAGGFAGGFFLGLGSA